VSCPRDFPPKSPPSFSVSATSDELTKIGMRYLCPNRRNWTTHVPSPQAKPSRHQVSFDSMHLLFFFTSDRRLMQRNLSMTGFLSSISEVLPVSLLMLLTSTLLPRLVHLFLVPDRASFALGSSSKVFRLCVARKRRSERGHEKVEGKSIRSEFIERCNIYRSLVG
jgi:hypothetical protein